MYKKQKKCFRKRAMQFYLEISIGKKSKKRTELAFYYYSEKCFLGFISKRKEKIIREKKKVKERKKRQERGTKGKKGKERTRRGKKNKGRKDKVREVRILIMWEVQEASFQSTERG